MGPGSEEKVVQIDRAKPPERIAHELGNLLAVAIGQAEYLLHDDGRGDPAERRECLEAIRQAALDARESVRRLHRVVKQIGEMPNAPGGPAVARVWHALLGQALEALGPGEAFQFRVEKDDNALVVEIPTGFPLPEALVLSVGGSLGLREVGGESRLTIRVPTLAAPPAPTEIGEARRRGSATVLIIDDQEEVREAMAALLRQVGHRVETAATGAEGLQRYRQERFDCVVTDMIMPGLGGLTVSRAIKDYDPDAYVVLLTGAEYEGAPEELRAAGVDRLLVKPLSRAEILGLAERNVGRAHVGRSLSETP